MPLTLKSYQINALGALEAFFVRARGTRDELKTAAAFSAARTEVLGDSAPRSLYRRFCAEQPEVPIACIRIPTGGGKTLLAAHAIERAARLYVGTNSPIALWLVPSNTIRVQTLEALQQTGHPYREALEQHFPADRLCVIDIEDCEQLRAEDFTGRAIVIVATLQTLRVGNTASRKVYSYKEAFEPHFVRMPSEVPYFERVTQADLDEQPYLQTRDIGRVKYSFANLLAFYRPIVIVDEAHNANTTLSSEALARIRPACIIEWTATPATEQNVLYTVSAQELKAENMIKLPIVLKGHPNWQEAVQDAILTRDRLLKECEGESEYIRPIILFQADPSNGEVPVDVLMKHLIEDRHIEDRRIAVATGDQRGLSGINLFDRSCPIDFVITVEALKEGWDCSFAYVFSTVQRIRSTKDLEQLLGRVLRLPYATRCNSEHLNRAYAHVSEQATLDTADKLVDLLVGMGFEDFEAASAVVPQSADLFSDSGRIPPPPNQVQSTVVMPAAAADQLLAAGGGAVHLERTGDAYTATITGILSQAAIDQAISATPKREQDELRRKLVHHRTRALLAASPRDRGAHFRAVPQLSLLVQGEIVLFDPAILLDLTNFSLAGRDASISDLPDRPDAAAYLIDVDGDRVRIGLEQSEAQLNLDRATEGIRREDIIRTLDRKLHRIDLLQADVIAWLGRAIDDLIRRGKSLTWLARHINYVSDAFAAKLSALQATAQRETFQSALGFAEEAKRPRIDARFEFRFPESNYPAKTRYNGRYTFTKHFYGPPGDLQDDNDSEETRCAIALDQSPDVKQWIRNLERQPATSFWLPTSTDRFYPDFVAELNDGRLLVIEYKGAHLLSNDDSREKRDIGLVWALASGGQCVFAMITSPEAASNKSLADQIHEAVG